MSIANDFVLTVEQLTAYLQTFPSESFVVMIDHRGDMRAPDFDFQEVIRGAADAGPVLTIIDPTPVTEPAREYRVCEVHGGVLESDRKFDTLGEAERWLANLGDSCRRRGIDCRFVMEQRPVGPWTAVKA